MAINRNLPHLAWEKIRMNSVVAYLFIFVWGLTVLLSCDTAPVIREDAITSEKDQAPPPEYFFGLNVEPSLDEMGCQIPFRGVDENGFPLTPDEFPSDPVWSRESEQRLSVLKNLIANNYPPDKPVNWEELINAFVLMNKVLIKLWNQGDHHLHGGVIDEKRKVLPHYPNTVYVKWAEWIDRNGVKIRYIKNAVSGKKLLTTEELRTGQIRPGIRVLDYDSDSYDPYDFLTEVELNAGCGSEIAGVLIECLNSTNKADE